MALNRWVTRFNPTVNGPLHMGHVLNILVNEAEAHASGGKFYFRFEDDQYYWVWRVGPYETKRLADEMIEDVNWLGIQVDEWLWQSKMRPTMLQLFEQLKKHHLDGIAERIMFDPHPETTFLETHAYPYAPYLTAERVIYDMMSEITSVIRGSDLMSEANLYTFFCECFGTFPPRLVYIDRLSGNLQTELSKTSGNGKIRDYRASGVNAGDLLERLRKACLKDPRGPWLLTNLKARPAWTA